MAASSTPRETWELNIKVSVLSFSPRKTNTNCYVRLWRTKTSSGVAGGLPIKGGNDTPLRLSIRPGGSCREAAPVGAAPWTWSLLVP